MPIPSKPTFLFPSLIQPINCSQPDLSTAQFPTHLPPFLTLACKNSQIFHMVFSIRELPDYFFRMLIFGPFSTYCDCCDCSRTAKERFPLFYFFLGCCSFFPNFFFSWFSPGFFSWISLFFSILFPPFICTPFVTTLSISSFYWFTIYKFTGWNLKRKWCQHKNKPYPRTSKP